MSDGGGLAHLENAHPRESEATERKPSPNGPSSTVRRSPTMEVGAHDDPAERAADLMASRVVEVLRSPGPLPDEAAPRTRRVSAASHVVRRSATPRIVRRAATRPAETVIGSGGGPVSADTAGRIARSAGRGRPLDPTVQRTMERAFGGASFDGVEVHGGPESRRLNDELGARAFTLGRDIHFRDGVPDTASPDGQRLLAHELTHTLQQGTVGRRTIRRDLTDATGLNTYHKSNANTQGGPTGKHEQANDWLTGVQGGTAAPGEFSSANSYQQGLAESRGTAVTGQVGDTRVGNNLTLSSSVMSGFDLVVGVSKLIQAFQNSEASKMDTAEAALAVGGSATKTAAGIGDSVKGFQDAAKDSATAVAASILGEIAAIFTTIQNGFALVKQISSATQVESSQEKALAGAEIVKAILEAGKSIIETINAFMSHLGSAVTGMLQAVPAIGIAISVLEWILNGINIGFSYVAWAAMQLDKRASKALVLGRQANKSEGIRGFFGGHESADVLAKDLIQIGKDLAAAEAAHAVSTGEATSADDKVAQIEAEIKVLTDKEAAAKAAKPAKGTPAPPPLSRADQQKLKGLKNDLKAAKTGQSAAAAKKTATQKVQDKHSAGLAARGGDKNKVAAAEEYLVSKNLQRIAAKRIHRGILNISVTLPSVAGDIATLSGVGAAVGAGLKAGGGGAKLLAIGVRKGKQAYHNAKGDEKSEANKLKMYDGLIRAMTQHAIDAVGVPAKEQKATREIEASGMSMVTMARLKGNAPKLHEAWIAALKKR